jgi:hypothetical protein
VRTLVKQFALSGIEILLPLTLEMYERPATLAKREMLKSGEREEFVLYIQSKLRSDDMLVNPVD